MFFKREAHEDTKAGKSDQQGFKGYGPEAITALGAAGPQYGPVSLDPSRLPSMLFRSSARASW
ncbi:hypothetical protein TVD_11505 [Thioalkalivibrio versutus]|uniref:Uncharacterized protein n=1 Tax=Thioalkalivibrio versutus TaxID=106634 RepID=A0A0G3G3Y6_9GAMM|nr:hypothetical protein TVD_11505 [Thioalkalivibrio versutus]